MIYMLDTNICIYIINKQPEHVANKLDELVKKGAMISISSVVLSELQYGIEKSKYKEKNQEKVNKLLSKLDVIDYSSSCAYFYGKIRSELELKGSIIGNNDLFIASHAIEQNAILITNNVSEFKKVENLKIENIACP